MEDLATFPLFTIFVGDHGDGDVHVLAHLHGILADRDPDGVVPPHAPVICLPLPIWLYRNCLKQKTGFEVRYGGENIKCMYTVQTQHCDG